MNAMPKEDEIVLFRYRNRLMAGVCVNASRTKARFAVSSKESLNVPLENILQTTGQPGGDKAAGKVWLGQAETASRDIDLSELWELVQEDGGAWTSDDLAELYYNQPPTPAQASAMLVALEVGDYFDVEGRRFCAVDPEELERRLEVATRAEERAAERDAFLQWFTSDAKADNAEWINRVKDVVLQGDQSVQLQWLERMVGEPVSVRRAFDRLVVEGVWDPHAFVELMREDLPLAFPSELENEIGEIDIASLFDSRKDLTHLDAVTIDDASTTDMDDAVSVLFRKDGTFQVGVHITDVTALVFLDSLVDREAKSRGASLYFPEVKFPMLPSGLSENLGSLLPDENRLAVSLLWDVDGDGHLGPSTWALSVIRCGAKLSYDDVDAILDDVAHPRHAMLSALFEVAEALLLERADAGAPVVAHVDRRVKVSADGTVDVAVKMRNSRADLTVSELMVMYNVQAARLCVAQNAPIIFRVQSAPDLSDVEPTDIEQLHRYRVLTRMRGASVSHEPGLHGGLGVEPYCQVTSPLRRFLDLVSQRQLVSVIANQPLSYETDTLQELCPEVEERLRTISRLERRRERYWTYVYLSQYKGQAFDALVMDVWERRARIEVLAWALQVDVRLSGRLSVGEYVSVRLAQVDPWADDITFVLA